MYEIPEKVQLKLQEALKENQKKKEYEQFVQVCFDNDICPICGEKLTVKRITFTTSKFFKVCSKSKEHFKKVVDISSID